VQRVNTLLVLWTKALLFFLASFFDLFDANSFLLSLELKDLVFIQTLQGLLIAECALEAMKHVLGLRWLNSCGDDNLSRVLVRHCMWLALVVKHKWVSRLGATSWIGRSWQLVDLTVIALFFVGLPGRFLLFLGRLFGGGRGGFRLLEHRRHIEPFVFTFVRVKSPLLL